MLQHGAALKELLQPLWDFQGSVIQVLLERSGELETSGDEADAGGRGNTEADANENAW